MHLLEKFFPNKGIAVKYLLIFTLLAGCANIQDNTTAIDKVIIATTFALIASGATRLMQ